MQNKANMPATATWRELRQLVRDFVTPRLIVSSSVWALSVWALSVWALSFEHCCGGSVFIYSCHLLRLGWTHTCRGGKQETLLHQNLYSCAPFSVQSDMSLYGKDASVGISLFLIPKLFSTKLTVPDTAVEIIIINVLAQLLWWEFKCCVNNKGPAEKFPRAWSVRWTPHWMLWFQSYAYHIEQSRPQCRQWWVMSWVSLIGAELGQRDGMSYFFPNRQITQNALTTSFGQVRHPFVETNASARRHWSSNECSGSCSPSSVRLDTCRSAKQETPFLQQNLYSYAPFSVQSDTALYGKDASAGDCTWYGSWNYDFRVLAHLALITTNPLKIASGLISQVDPALDEMISELCMP